MVIHIRAGGILNNIVENVFHQKVFHKERIVLDKNARLHMIINQQQKKANKKQKPQ